MKALKAVLVLMFYICASLVVVSLSVLAYTYKTLQVEQVLLMLLIITANGGVSALCHACYHSILDTSKVEYLD